MDIRFENISKLSFQELNSDGHV
jgi:hypothetical protein